MQCYLTLPTYKIIVGAPITLRDVQFVDQQLHSSLRQLLHMPPLEVNKRQGVVVMIVAVVVVTGKRDEKQSRNESGNEK